MLLGYEITGSSDFPLHPVDISKIAEIWQSYRFRNIPGKSTIYNLGDFAFTKFRIAASGKAPQALLDRMSLNGMEQPGHYRLRDLPSTVWPPPVERGDYVTQTPVEVRTQ